MSNENVRFSIAPDIHPDYLPGWHIFLRYIQKQLQISMSISSYENFSELRHVLQHDGVDMVFASAADCSYLVKNKQFMAIAQPENDVTEVMVLCREDAPWQCMDDIDDVPHTIASVDSAEVKYLGLILLESADLNADHVQVQMAKNHLQVAKFLMNHEVDLAFVPTEVYHSWSSTLRKTMRPLVQTLKDDVDALSHVLLLSKQYQHLASPLKQILQDVNGNTYQGLLQDINIKKWCVFHDNSDVDFLIDLVDTLQI